MMWLVSGTYTGKPESFAVFIHPLLSWTFSKLYSFFPQVNWYPATWFLVMYFSFAGFLFSFQKYKYSERLRIFYSLFLLAFVIHFLFFLQFSIVSAFSIAAGLVARGLKFSSKADSDSEDEERISPFAFLKTDLLILMGAMIRLEVLFLFLAGIFVLGFLIFRNVFKITSLVLPGILLLILFLFNQAWIRMEGLQDFDTTNKLRSSVFDDPVLQLRKETYRESNPELYYFANGLMDFGREADLIPKMEIWKTQLNQERLEVISPSYLFKSLTYLIWNERYFCFLFFLLLAFSLVFQLKKSVLSIGVLLVIMVLLSPFFLLKIQVYVIIFLVFFSSLILFDAGKKHPSKILIPILSLLPVLIIVHLYSIFTSEKNLFPLEEFDKFKDFETLYPGPQDVYIVGLDKVNFYFLENKTVRIKYLGWPSLLLNSNNGHAVYRVNRVVYEGNTGYFKSSEVINEYSEYLDLIFLK